MFSSKKLLELLLACSIIACSAIFSYSNTVVKPEKSVGALNSLLDLSQYNLSGNPVKLDGEWEFYWQQLLAPADFYQSFLLGAFSIMSVYHFGLFYLRRQEKSAFYFGLFCLTIALRTICSGEMILVETYPNLSWDILLKLEYLTYYLAVPIFIKFIYHLYASDLPSQITNAFTLLSLSFSTLVITTSVKFYSRTLEWYNFITLLGFVYAGIILFRAVKNRKEGSRSFLLGVLLFLITVLNDMLLSNGLIPTGKMVPLGLFLFIFFQALSLSTRFPRTYTAIESVSKKLQEYITEQKDLEKEMARLDRLNIIGQMAAGISHEVRNPMTTVSGFLQLLAKKEQNSQNREYYDLMLSELARANSILTEYLSITRAPATDFQMQNINTILLALLPLLKADAIKQGKDIVLNVQQVPALRLNGGEIRQLILNLCRNGLEAMAKGGKTLTITTYAQQEEVILSIKDEGSGIPQEIFNKLGTPFLSTKDGGTGLGLAVCYGIAAGHKASIEVITDHNGTDFLVKFKQKSLN